MDIQLFILQQKNSSKQMKKMKIGIIIENNFIKRIVYSKICYNRDFEIIHNFIQIILSSDEADISEVVINSRVLMH